MLETKFRAPKSARYYVIGDWITNGHWAVKKPAIESTTLYPAVKWLRLLPDGTYEGGEKTGQSTPDMARVIPSGIDRRFHKATVTSEARFCLKTKTIRYVLLKTEDGTKAGVAPEYVQLLLAAEEILIQCSLTPIVLRSAGEIIGLVMPVRLQDEDKMEGYVNREGVNAHGYANS